MSALVITTPSLILHAGFEAEFQNCPADVVLEVTQSARFKLRVPRKRKAKEGNQFRLESKIKQEGKKTNGSIRVPLGIVPRVVEALNSNGIKVVIDDHRPPSPLGTTRIQASLHGMTAETANILEQVRLYSIARPAVRSKLDALTIISAAYRSMKNGTIVIQNTFPSHPGYLQAHELHRYLGEPVLSSNDQFQNSNVGIHLISRKKQAYYRVGCRPDLIIVVNADDDIREVPVLDQDGTRKIPTPFGKWIRSVKGLCPKACLAFDWHGTRHPEDEWTLECLHGPVITAMNSRPALSVIMVYARLLHERYRDDALLFKRNGIWNNRVRNQFVADIASAATGANILLGRGALNHHLEVYRTSLSKVAVIVENEQHARALQAEFLQDWPIRSLTHEGDDSPSCIVTLSYLLERGHKASLWVRATGGIEPFGSLREKLTAERTGELSPPATLLIDLFDQNLGRADYQSRTRLQDYQQSGWHVTEGTDVPHHETRRRPSRRRPWDPGPRPQAGRAGNRSNAGANGPGDLHSPSYPEETPIGE
jgi:hypothetical protein